MKKNDHIYNVNKGQVNINHGSGTINANYTINKQNKDNDMLLDSLQHLLHTLDQEKEVGFIVKHSIESQIEPVMEEIQNENISKSKLQKFRDFLSNCLPELQAFSAVCAAVSATKDAIDLKLLGL
jgi:hypothetical protein